LFLAGRVIQAASATGIVLSRAIVRDVYDRERAAAMIGYVTMGLAVAPMIGPMIGGFVDTAFGWRAVFWLLAGAGVLTIGFILADLSETNTAIGTPMRTQFKSYGALFGAGAFWTYALVSALTSAVFFSFLGGAPFVAVNVLHMTPADYGLWFALCAVGYMGGNFASAQLSTRLDIKTLMVSGTGLALFAPVLALIFLLAGLFSPATLFAPMLIVGFGNGLALPPATAGGVSVVPHAAGAAAGVLGALQIGLGALASFVAAVLATGSAGATGLLMLMVGFGLAALLTALSAKRVRKAA